MFKVQQMPSGLWNAAVGKEGSFPGHLTRSFPGTSAGGDGRAGEQVAAAPHPRWQMAACIPNFWLHSPLGDVSRLSENN